jgi:uncharacterized membrane protein YgdD (TMEM256/DUF423 family)
MKPGNVFVAWGGFLAALAMALGAVGSHLLQGRLSPALMNIYHIANQFQIYHALGLILVGILMQTQQGRSVTLLRWAGWIVLLGIVLFLRWLDGVDPDGLDVDGDPCSLWWYGFHRGMDPGGGGGVAGLMGGNRKR